MNPAAFNPAYLFLYIYNFLVWLLTLQWVGGASAANVTFSNDFNLALAILRPLGTFIWLLLAAGIIYCIVRIEQIRRAEHEKMALSPQGATDAHVSSAPPISEPPGAVAWRDVLAKAGSQNPGDWRVAILEADILLDQALGEAGYSGTLGDKLQGIASSDNFPLDAAWEAHKVRNSIAHEGAGYDLTDRDAKRAIGNYQLALESLRYI